MLLIKSYESEKVCLIFEKWRKHLSKVTKIRFSVSENPTLKVFSSHLQKCEILLFLLFLLVFFCQKKDRGCVFFFRGYRFQPMVLEDRERAHLKRN